MKEKGDPCILVGSSTQSKGYRVYNKRTQLIVKSRHLRFNEIKEMSKTFVDNKTSGLVPQRQKASDYDNSGPVTQLQNFSSSAAATAPSQQELDLLFDPLYDEFFNEALKNKESLEAESIVRAASTRVRFHLLTTPFCSGVQRVECEQKLLRLEDFIESS
nr:hypothetical protein [Tanacetum cinerariifolium]